MNKTLIIAEAGVNHNGSVETAMQLALAAKEAGADVVKYQTCVPELVVSRFAEKAEYQKRETGAAQSQLEMIRQLHFDWNGHRRVKQFCDAIGIQYLSTAFDLPSIDFLETLDLPFHKVPSGEITNLPYLQRIAACGKPALVSTGMCEMDEIAAAVEVLQQGGCGELTLLHCNTEYPTPYEDANLLALEALRARFGRRVGYSDHTAGVTAAVAAVALGACVIEKHFTLDKTQPGPDHKASLEPEELAALCRAVRDTERLLGGGEKHVTQSEAKNRAVARKSIVAQRPIARGESYTAENLTVKRPGTGVSPMRWYEVLGKKAPRDFEEDECIEL
ncbi:MAG: N-acetylneuraminate synthase [Oscillospiraceae bacterium]|nr:N-acetylneuraminate synthase [Oscillospiraceae bacterium]